MAPKGRIERLNERLDSRTRYTEPKDAPQPIVGAASSAEAVAEPSPGWDSPPIDDYLTAERRRPESYPLMKKIFIISILFAVCASGAAALIYFKGDNFISTKNLDIEVNAPVNISAGSPVDMQITITNKNNAAISDVNMTAIFPDGTKSVADGQNADLPSVHETVDSLGSGEKKNIPIQAAFFGAEGEVETVRISVTYQVGGSNATFTKEKSVDLTIGSAPVSVTVTRPEVVTSGEPFTLTWNVTSNSEETLNNIAFKAEYPYGFSVSSASPKANDSDQSIWLLGDLAPGQKQNISIKGVLLGQNQDQRTLRYMVGVGDAGGVKTILSADSAILTLNRPAVDLTTSLNGDTDADYVAPAGKPIQVSINFKNNLTSNFLNPELRVTLSGSALDRSSVVPQDGGFYNSTANAVVWNNGNSNLKTLSPGDSGSVTLTFNTLTNLPPNVLNPKVDLSFSLTGKEQDSGNSDQISDTRTVKVASAVVLDSKSLYSKGPFENTGPIPPKAENETTYTIALSLTNTQNDILNGEVTGLLGPNVKWLGSEDPSITYDDKTNTVSWEVGTLNSGVGFSSPVDQANFKVSLTPSLGQVGGVPALITNLAFEGLDSFTKSNIRLSNPDVTTRISSDPTYVQGDETVVK